MTRFGALSDSLSVAGSAARGENRLWTVTFDRLQSELNAVSGQIRMREDGGLAIVLNLGIRSVCRMLSVNEFLVAMHKRHAPQRHIHLALLGVDPSFQGQGHGGSLLKSILARLDRENLPCYLDTQNQSNVVFYQRYGFEVVEYTLIPGTDVNCWAMLRANSGL